MPRYKFEYSSISVRVFKRFRKAHPEIRIEKNKWAKVIQTFNQLFAEYLLQTGEREKLPYGLGSFSISKKKTIKIVRKKNGEEHINLPVDWQKSKEYGKKIYIMNTHSDGFRCRWKWFSEDSNLRLSHIWVCKPIRERSRDIARYLKDSDGDVYLEKWKQWERKR
jgi:hypothetical protein